MDNPHHPGKPTLVIWALESAAPDAVFLPYSRQFASIRGSLKAFEIRSNSFMKIHLLSARLTVGSLAVALLASCALSGFATSQRRVPFNEAEFAAYRGSGPRQCGGAVVRHLQRWGGPRREAGQGPNSIHVTLLPVTAYTREMVEREIGDGEIWARPIRDFKSMRGSRTQTRMAISRSVKSRPANTSCAGSVQRRADFVAHRGEKVRLGAVCVLGLHA